MIHYRQDRARQTSPGATFLLPVAYMPGFADALPSKEALARMNGGTLARAIDQLCEGRGIAPSRFGIEAVGDRALVRALRAGRHLRDNTRARVLAYFDAVRTGKAVRA